MDVHQARAGNDVLVAPRPNRSVRKASRPTSRVVRAAKSAWPPSEGDGTSAPPLLTSSASPRPVPGAMSDTLPSGFAVPAWSVRSSSARQHRDRVGHGSQIVQQADGRRVPASRRPTRASICQSALVRAAGRCTPGPPRRTRPPRRDAGLWPASARNGASIDSSVGEVACRVRADFDSGGPWGGGLEQAQPGVRASDVSREQHANSCPVARHRSASPRPRPRPIRQPRGRS